MTGRTVLDLEAQTRAVARLAAGVPDARMDDPTPCPEYTVGVLLVHLTGLAVAFRDAARKDLGPTTDTAPDPAATPLPADWRAELPRALGELAEAWRDPAAWTGMTRAGSVDLPGEIAGAVAVDELVIHGWDLARATGQEYAPDRAALRAAYDFLLAAAEDESRGGGIFGPVVSVPDDAPLLDRAVGLSGRDPAWTPPATP
ncbi:TIGR03086 family metal-binding protein [Streptomyces virginiae]|uniref:TIGR03086 family metal-binding protein n=1 Tax=Streptomyces virginiae TaxID=1961 RepID=UPI002DB8BBC3|nr:TIGR03086 family metal-binding protein [Streptomyces sp. CMAA1738]MEC4574260.1 TIGR03086 family metal-binding protein [Streptomyces sp. CMAA1738]